MSGIDRLVICSPYDMPCEHWQYNHTTGKHERAQGRRPAGYVRAAPPSSRSTGDQGEFRPLRLPNLIRARVDRWRSAGYPGITGTTRRLLTHWRDGEARPERLFFCQIEAIETIIWLTEADKADKAGLDVQGDGGEFLRLCLKMATGTGKTVVMAMLIAWHALNKAACPADGRFSRRFLVVAPGLTVKSRLGVLWPPDGGDSYYRRYSIVPDSMYEDFKKAGVVVHNWHTLTPKEDARHGVVRKGPEDDAAFASRILRRGGGNIVVINDEAHHAWRRKPGDALGANKEERDLEQMATVWMDGLDRIHRARGIRACFGFTATPFMPSTRGGSKRRPGSADAGYNEPLYSWIVYDFSLNDAIESGLVKTPRMPAGDGDMPPEDGDMSRYYHLYEDPTVKPDLTSRARVDVPLPDLVRTAYMILANDWRRTRDAAVGSPVPPVMITVCNNTRTAARIGNFFSDDPYDFGELAEDDSMLRIDTDVLKADRQGGSGAGDELRDTANTVGQLGKRGEQIKNIVAVQMLSEGWDAKNVTQIMGLRAFTSQLLCEQVIGRGLRRQSYEPDPETGLLREEHVNVMGVPFSFLPREELPVNPPPPPPPPKTRVGPDPRNADHEITWPNVARIETVLAPVLRIDWASASRLDLNAGDIDDTVQFVPVLEGRPDMARASIATLRGDYGHLRMQTIVFHTVLAMLGEIAIPRWRGGRHLLFAQLAGITSRFIESGMIAVTGTADGHEVRRNLAVMFNMKSVVDHVIGFVNAGNVKSKRVVFAPGRKSGSTGKVKHWYTAKDLIKPAKSHIYPSPYDNAWEMDAALEMERNGRVMSWVKNEMRVGLAIRYKYEGVVHDYYPDYLIRLGRRKGDGGGNGGEQNGTMLVLEIKGQRTPKSDAKHEALAEWIEAVNEHGGHGRWAWDVAYNPADVGPIVRRHCP